MIFLLIFTLNCYIMSTCGLQHSSMWDMETAAQGAGWATLTFTNSNLDVIKTNFESAGMVALYPLKWTVPQSKLCYAPVTHMQTYADGTFPCVTIDPNYTSSWQSQWEEIKPLVDIGAITGIFLGDERMYFGIHLSEVKLIADEIRRTWPRAIIFMNEAPDIAMCNMRKDNTSVFKDDECVPTNVDWFGFDFYQTDSVSWTASHEAFNTILYPRFSRTSQRFLPTTMGHFPDASNKTDAFCVQNAIEWTRIALNDPRIVAIFAFGGAFGPMDNSRCSQMFQAMGKMVMAAGKLGTSFDPIGEAAAPDSQGNFAEPKCLSPRQPSPSIWNWCDRSGDNLWTCDPATHQCVKTAIGTFPTMASCNTTCFKRAL
eukprot:m.123281 g.123281  ORF g.123281 m.123281 type:complete len:371 (+) comp28977_c0_seq1:172-1284(+)